MIAVTPVTRNHAGGTDAGASGTSGGSLDGQRSRRAPVYLAQHVYTRLPQRESLRGLEGWQTAYYTAPSDSLQDDVGLSPQDVRDIEDYLQHNRTFPLDADRQPPKDAARYHVFPLSGDRIVATRVVPLPALDRSGETCLYLAHSVVWPRDLAERCPDGIVGLLKPGVTPFADDLLDVRPLRDRQTHFVDPVAVKQEVLATWDRLAGSTSSLASNTLPMTNGASRAWSPVELARLAALGATAPSFAGARRAVAICGERDEILDTLRLLFRLQEPSRWWQLSFTTWSPPEGAVLPPFWAVGMEQPPRSPRYAVVDARQGAVRGEILTGASDGQSQPELPDAPEAHARWLLTTPWQERAAGGTPITVEWLAAQRASVEALAEALAEAAREMPEGSRSESEADFVWETVTKTADVLRRSAPWMLTDFVQANTHLTRAALWQRLHRHFPQPRLTSLLYEGRIAGQNSAGLAEMLSPDARERDTLLDHLEVHLPYDLLRAPSQTEGTALRHALAAAPDHAYLGLRAVVALAAKEYWPLRRVLAAIPEEACRAFVYAQLVVLATQASEPHRSTWLGPLGWVHCARPMPQVPRSTAVEHAGVPADERVAHSTLCLDAVARAFADAAPLLLLRKETSWFVPLVRELVRAGNYSATAALTGYVAALPPQVAAQLAQTLGQPYGRLPELEALAAAANRVRRGRL